ncbi:MAG: hypothetical protein KBD78_12650 [Oligoflexales bacterium]|nr:hypothetical protein [Oligoflexales bacterium]
MLKYVVFVLVAFGICSSAFATFPIAQECQFSASLLSIMPLGELNSQVSTREVPKVAVVSLRSIVSSSDVKRCESILNKKVAVFAFSENELQDKMIGKKIDLLYEETTLGKTGLSGSSYGFKWSILAQQTNAAVEVLEANYDHQTDMLILTVKYSGGCEPHVFDLEVNRCLAMNPLICDVVLTNTSADTCKALITETIEMDLNKSGIDVSKFAGAKLKIRGFGTDSAQTVQLPGLELDHGIYAL